MSSMQLERIDRAREVLTSMLRHRGYDVEDAERLIFTQPSSSPARIKAFLCCFSKLNIDRIKAYIQELGELGIHHCILIYDDIITTSCKKILERMVMYTFETFHMDEMQYDLTKHVLYCPHERLTSGLNLNPAAVKKFPVLLKTDAVCRYFHFQKGDIIRIRRPEGIIVYRVVQ